jgi:CDP-glucose 4,6-dehydratase
MIKKNFWKNKRVFITGHTGFKGGWLSIWLKLLGAHVTGYSLKPDTNPSLFHLTNLGNYIDKSYIKDVTNLSDLKKAITNSKSTILFHLAAQPSVRFSYKNSYETVKTNILGSINILEILKGKSEIKSVVMIATDKVYENKEKKISFKEESPLGGTDIYSASKACSEILVNAYRNSFFKNTKLNIGSARSGNVIGGGDWTRDRIVPDCLSSFVKNKKLIIRYPKSIRPWQHVLEPIYGYLLLAEKLYSHEGVNFSKAWNFGPKKENNTNVYELAKKLKTITNSKSKIVTSKIKNFSEAKYLFLDSSKSMKLLKWKKMLNLKQTLNLINEWYQAFLNKKDLRKVTISQIKYFTKALNEKKI